MGVENNGEFIIDYTPLNNPKYISLKNFVDEKWIILFDSIYMYIDKDLLVYINGKPIPKFLQMKCYMLKTPSIDIDSLSKIDGYILGVELDLTNSFDSNWAKYESDMLGKTVNSMQEMGYDRIYEIINTYDEYHKDSGFTLDDFKFRLKILNFFRVSLRNIQRVSRQIYEASTRT